MNWSKLEGVLGYTFNNRDLLVRALTHRSYVNESNDTDKDNQRLEFLGDAVLGLVLTELLFARHPDYTEGALSKLKSQLVCEPALATIAARIELGSYLRLGKGEESSGGREKASVLADAYEALLAAVHLDGGFESARRLIRSQHADPLQGITSPSTGLDAKSKLQEHLQRDSGVRPTYHILEATGPHHARRFSVSVSLGEEVLGVGEGSSKKEAQQAAAFAALHALNEAESTDD